MLALLAAALAPSACFRGAFLDDTCEQLGGCTLTTTGATDVGTSSSTALPTTTDDTTAETGSGSSTTDDGRVELSALAFRIDSLQLIDPDIHAPLFSGTICTNVRMDLSTALNGEVASGDTNLLFVAPNYDPAADQIEIKLYQRPTCDVVLGECTLTSEEIPLSFPVKNRDDGNCAEYDTSGIKPANLPALNLPDSPCFATPQLSYPLKISENIGEVDFARLQMSASYLPDDTDPSEGLGDSVIAGFIRETDAEMISYNFNGAAINLWSVIAGSDHPDECATENNIPPDVDLLDLEGPGGVPDGVPETPGVWLFLNFTAERVRLFAPA